MTYSEEKDLQVVFNKYLQETHSKNNVKAKKMYLKNATSPVNPISQTRLFVYLVIRGHNIGMFY